MYRITLDPGHGGSDPGAVYGNLIEKNIVLVVALKCREELIRHGVEVQMTRASDVYVGLSERAIMANNNKSDFFVSIHCNAGGGDRGEVIYSIYKGKGLELTNKISNEMMKIGQTAVKTYNKMGSGGVDYFAVIRETSMDSIIVECAFLDNETDNKIIDSIEKQQAFGIAIAKGILEQLGISYKESNQSTIPSENSTDNTTWDNSVKGKIGVITANDVNARLDPNGTIIGSLNKGDKVKLYRLEGDWYHCYGIKLSYNRTYVYKDYVDVTEENTNTTDKKEGIAYCTVPVLNVRNGAGTGYYIQGVLNLNEKVAVLAKSGNWRQVRYYNASANANKIGWVNASYLKIEIDV